MQNHVKAEFKRLLGISLNVSAYARTSDFPYFMLDIYDFFLCVASGKSFLLMCASKGIDYAYTPGGVAKHMAVTQNASGLPAVFAAEKMPAYRRDRFLEKRIPFIIPGKQAYIPFIGVFLTEGGPRLKRHFDELGNLAQILILGRLQRKFTTPLSIAEATGMFSYSRISVIRAFDELEFFQLAQRNPRNKHLEFSLTGKELWEKALPFLKTPCRESIGLERMPELIPCFPAGINALSERSMLSADTQLRFAAEAKKLYKTKLFGQCEKEDAPFVLELWKYPPNIIGGDSIDSLSLYLTLRHDPDDRVQIAIDEMMEGIPW